MLWERFAFFLIVAFLSWNPVFAQQFDQNAAWPLCGRISENPPAGWVTSDGCPPVRWGNFDYTDLPLASPFGPRPLASENDRYDFHRGIDIATDEGTPVFAIADGRRGHVLRAARREARGESLTPARRPDLAADQP